MATSGARRRPQKYPIELRERAVRMVLEIRQEPVDHPGVIGRSRSSSGSGPSGCVAGSRRPRSTVAASPARQRLTSNGSSSWNARTGSCVARTTWRNQPVSALGL